MNSRYLFILVSLLILISCSKKEQIDIYYNLDHTQWFQYEVGDTLIFQNNTSAIDTYILDEVSTFYATPYNKYTYEEFFQVVYNGIQCNSCPIWDFIRTPKSVSFSGNFQIISYHAGDTITEYKLGDTTIYEVYVLKDIPKEDTINCQVKAFYYSHIYGYIRYDMYDDRVYELQLE